MSVVGGIFTQVVFSGQKLPIRTISALADIAETQGFALGPNVKLASPKELEGKKLAYTQGNSQILLIAKLAKMYDFDMAKITLVNMQQSEGIVAASKGDVAGLLGWQPNLYRLISMGGSMYATGTQLFVTGKEQVLPFSDRLQYNHSVLLASQDWIDNKPNTLIALMGAMKRATDLLSDRQAPRAGGDAAGAEDRHGRAEGDGGGEQVQPRDLRLAGPQPDVPERLGAVGQAHRRTGDARTILRAEHPGRDGPLAGHLEGVNLF